MRKLTELLQEIPLDEMMGDAIMKNTENNKNLSAKEGTPARVRSRAPIYGAVAACAVLAFGGVMMFNRNLPENDTVPAAQAVTDAEDTVSEEISAEKDIAAQNLEYAMLPYSTFGYDYELAAPYKTVFEDRVGTINSGFDGLDIRVISVTACYPFVDVEVAVSNIDGSPLPEVEVANAVEFKADASFMNWNAGGLQHYGDVAIGTIRTTLTEDRLDEGAAASIGLKQITFDDVVYNGSFTATVNIDKIGFADRTVTSGEKGSYTGYIYGEREDIDFTVNSVTFCSSGVGIDLELEKRYDNNQLTEMFNNFGLLLKKYDDGFYDSYLAEAGIPEDAKLDFVNIVYKDGTSETLCAGDFASEWRNNGSCTVYYKLNYSPINADNIAKFVIGGVEVPVE